MFAKLFSRITESSLMEEPLPVRYVFMMLLAISDPKGYVIGTDIAIARRINIPLKEFETCIQALMSPDPDSNSKEEEGRRLLPSDCERGYKIVNYQTYRDARDEDQRREYMREYMQDYRKRKSVNSVSNGKPPLANAEAEGEAEGEEPPNPQRGNGSRVPTAESAIFIAKLFSRRLTTAWSEKEIRSFKKIGKIEMSDLKLIEAYYEAERLKPKGIHRRDILTFLNNFAGELDRAIAFNKKPRNKADDFRNGF